MSAEQVVEEQLHSYNARNLEQFVSFYSPEIKIFELSTGAMVVSGFEQLRQRYAARFQSPNLHAHIANRMTIGDYVIDSEEITGILESGIYRAIVIYEVKESLVHRLWIVK